MTIGYKFTEEQVTELIGEDLSLGASLADLLTNGGDIHNFLIQKLLDREEELATFHLSQASRWMDDRELKQALGIARAVGMPTY